MQECEKKEIIELLQKWVEEFDNPYLSKLYQQNSYGKMLRSRLILSIAPKSEESIRLCGIVELIQLASLLHDDVIDDSNMRRGKASLNTLFGDKNAIMLGDALYSKAFYKLCNFQTSIARSISNAVCLLSSGEILDVALGEKFNSSKELYIKMISQKTASLIASSAECAGILAGLDCKVYRYYGECLGIAFQIIDDVLDITQPQEVLGKPSMSDFKEGKTTLPYILLYESLDSQDRDKLVSMHQQELTENQKRWIMEKMTQYHCIERSYEVALEYASLALSKIQEKNPKLQEMIDSMIKRSF